MADHSDNPSVDTNPSDADRWNLRYAQGPPPRSITAPLILEALCPPFRPGSTALDVACGYGDGGLHLARLGVHAHLVDVSAVAIDIVRDRARTAGLRVDTSVADLTNDPLPPGPFDIISCVHYLDRPLLGRLSTLLRAGGHLLVAIATMTNLERHERPSARFLLDPGELGNLTPELTTQHHDEAWRDNGVHEAWLVAQKPVSAV